MDEFETANNWVTRDTMLARVNHNLTVLPNGQVLVSGGTRIINNTTPTLPMRTPQLWNPNAFTWSPGSGTNALDADPAIRGYHSSAILLPDGRVLSVGGNIELSVSDTTNQAWRDMRRASIFCPPYLYDASGNLKPRPTVVYVPDHVTYNQQFTICTPNPDVTKVALIKPASSTHAFNQDQRYVPLTFQYCDGGPPPAPKVLLIDSPSSSSVAPPGDYLLFLVKSDDTPSIGKWVQVSAVPSEEDCLCMFGGGAMFAGGGSSGWEEENSLLVAGEASPPLKLHSSLDNSRGAHALRIVQRPGSTTSVDRVALMALDHDSNVRAFAAKSSYLVGTTVGARSLGYRAKDTTSAAADMGDGSFVANAGDTLEIEFDAPAGTRVPLFLEARRGSRDLPAAGDLDLRALAQTKDSSGGWREIGRFEPRLEFAEEVIDSCLERVRLVFGQRTQIRNAGHVATSVGAAGPSVTVLDLLTADHSRLGSVSSAVVSAGGGSTQLAERDTLVVRWSAPTLPTGKVRSFFVTSQSTTTPTAQTNATTARSSVIDPSPTWTFKLDAPRPNPSLGFATIAYTLPASQHVRIRIHDVAGRLIRTLVDRVVAAGPGEVVWDGRDDGGRRVSPGVFFYLMEAGDWRSRKKMIFASAE
ncbi:MAG: galactose oxidase-like domain-containing protein [Candidatus Eiseniibacteriota bacterium]